MFTPNLVGKLRSRISRDVHGRSTYGNERICPFGIVNLEIGTQKTSVRADSSASRGAADETNAERGKILVANTVSVAIGDLFDFENQTYEVAAKHIRRSVLGSVDHFECDLEILPT